jgi:hypothetical protein
MVMNMRTEMVTPAMQTMRLAQVGEEIADGDEPTHVEGSGFRVQGSGTATTSRIAISSSATGSF